MRNLIAICAFLFSIVSGYSQSDLVTSLSSKVTDGEKVCANVEVTNYADRAMIIQGQNIRLFYNSENLMLSNVNLNGIIKEDAYDYELMTNRVHLDKKSIDQLDFDHDMGFLNYSIVANENYELQSILEPKEKALVQTVCFNKVKNHANIHDIVLAKDGVSDKYSKAFVQIEATPLNDEILIPVSLLDMELQKELAGLNR